MKKTRVIVVDDSALVRSLLAEIINRQGDMECIGAANDPLIAREMIREMNPDVITLDVEMPKALTDTGCIRCLDCITCGALTPSIPLFGKKEIKEEEDEPGDRV